MGRLTCFQTSPTTKHNVAPCMVTWMHLSAAVPPSCYLLMRSKADSLGAAQAGVDLKET